MKRLLACLFAALVACMHAHVPAHARQETRYTVILVGNRAGFQTSTVRPGGAREFAYEYNDRGRGPKYKTTIRLDAAGLPVSLDTSGNDYLKAPVAESFTFEGGVARWKNSAEAGEKRLAAGAFYNSMNGAPEEEARGAVDNFARLGYSQIKIYSSIKPELVPKLVALAHARGLRVSGHVPAFMSAEQFVRAGADEFQHINFFVLNFLFDDVKDTRTPARFTAVADRAATMGAARVMKRDGELGSIAPGKLADLILVEGDPARRISDIRRVTLVVK
ncbi:MAG: amidohydrolase family protein, partial [Pyrinomonadaceae bacterium]